MKYAALKIGDRVVVPKCYAATGFFSRFLGLMGRARIPAEEAILFPKCNSIHTFFMRFPIDVLLVSDSGEVVEVKESLAPWRMLLPRKGVRHVVELKSELSRELGLKAGMRLEFPGVFG
jgi:uncharacterized protein